MTTPPDRLAAALADRYRLERELGQGGMATVYLAQDLRHDRRVAVKLLRPELAAVIGAERFLAEIRTTANLQHPHILPLFDSGEAAGQLFYVMPYVEGESLRDRLTREKQLGIADAVRIATEIAGALDYAHRHGVIHRDIKPENILLHDGRALVADFGIALAASKAGSTRMTETGMSLGTPHYMSPEQAMGEREITARSDVYALGCVLYEMLTGEPPFTGPTAQAIVAKVMTARPEPVTTIRQTVPPAVAAAVHQAIQKLPADRFTTAAEFAAALAGQGSSASLLQDAPPVPARRAWLLPAAIALLGIAGSALAFRMGRARSAGLDAPVTYDAALPDSAPISFNAVSVSSAYGTPLRNLSVAPGGGFAVYAALRGDSTELWWRSLRTAEARLLPGTTGGTVPRVSPDESRVAYLAGVRVMVVPLAGGEARHLYDVQGASGLAWSGRDTVLVLYDDGTALATIDLNTRVVTPRSITRCPLGEWLPASRQFVCVWNGAMFLLDPATGTRHDIRLTSGGGAEPSELRGTAPGIVAGKYLAFLSPDGDFSAAPLDVATGIAGRPVPLLSGIRREPIGAGQYDIASDGRLVFAPGVDASVGRLARLRPGGTPDLLPVPAGAFQRFDLSPDGRWLAAVVPGPSHQELRLYDLRDGQMIAWWTAEYIRHPIWTPAGDALLFAVRDAGRWSILRGLPNSGHAPDTLYASSDAGAYLDPVDFRDPSAVILQNWETAAIAWVRPGPRWAAPTPLIATDARFGSLAPGGRLLAYQTVDGSHVMVTTFPAPGKRWQVAPEGVEPAWLSATEVLYRAGVAWYVVRVDPVTGEPAGAPRFFARDPRFSDTSGWSQRVTRDGWLLYLQSPEETSASYLRVVPGWAARMRAAVDSAN